MLETMAYINIGAAFFLLIGMVLILGRLLAGPTLYDRILAVNAFGTKAVLFLCLFSFIIGRPDGIDIAILYALMNFIATIAVLKFFRYRALDVSLAQSHIDKATVRSDRNNKS
ncbi:MAG: cation:proton antiporter [Acidimicrobiales bacterium]|nr:cation:proton antiporter [Hyphomonadaceae bacterium]RZV39970.1 MAG: cation:proton antiporter [Acidimicrobiales bacterium]